MTTSTKKESAAKLAEKLREAAQEKGGDYPSITKLMQVANEVATALEESTHVDGWIFSSDLSDEIRKANIEGQGYIPVSWISKAKILEDLAIKSTHVDDTASLAALVRERRKACRAREKELRLSSGKSYAQVDAVEREAKYTAGEITACDWFLKLIDRAKTEEET